MPDGLRVSVIGASGYTGQALVALLRAHPAIGRVTAAASRHEAEASVAAADWVFLATPAEASAALAWPLVARGVRVLDLSGAHRAASPAAHRSAYGFEHPFPEALAEAVYGFDAPATRLQQARLIANPGCYANALLSALVPLAKAGVVQAGAVVDATGISGVSGAGRTANERTMYMQVAENLAPYRTGRSHQHLVELERHTGMRWLFVPMVAPLKRGMLVSGTADVTPWLDGLRSTVQEPSSPAIPPQLPPLNLDDDPLWQQVAEAPSVLAVAGRASVQVHYELDEAAGRVVFVSVIDNLLRGAASHAVFNFNRACGWPDGSGLEAVSVDGE